MSDYTRKCIEGGFYEPGVRHVPRPIRRRLRSMPRAPKEPQAEAERLDPPLVPRKTPLPPQIGRFPTDEELDRLWGKV